MSDKIVYLMRGLPACGKSHAARRLAGSDGVVLETDQYFYSDVRDDPGIYNSDDQLFEVPPGGCKRRLANCRRSWEWSQCRYEAIRRVGCEEWLHGRVERTGFGMVARDSGTAQIQKEELAAFGSVGQSPGQVQYDHTSSASEDNPCVDGELEG